MLNVGCLFGRLNFLCFEGEICVKHHRIFDEKGIIFVVESIIYNSIVINLARNFRNIILRSILNWNSLNKIKN